MGTSDKRDGSIVVAVVGLLLALFLAVVLSTLSDWYRPVAISGLRFLPIFLFFVPFIGLPIVAILLALTYVGWMRPALTGRVQFTIWTWLGLLLLAALSGLWYLTSWSLGMRWQGRLYTVGCLVIGAILLIGAMAAGIAGRRLHSPRLALFGRWLVLGWVVTYGFPWLGEPM